MNKQNKAFVYNLLGFVFFYCLSYFLLYMFTGVRGLWLGLISFVVTTILTPKFQYSRQAGGDKIFMSWLFMKGIKEVK
jgi:Na+-driven multidrug efflux pump